MAARHQRRPLTLPGDPSLATGWNQLIAAYLLSMELKGLSPCTIASRRRLLARLAHWALAQQHPGPGALAARELAVYRHELHLHRTRSGTPLAARSQQQHLIAIRVFYRWLIDHDHLTDDPTQRLEQPKAPYRLPRVILEADQIETVLDTTNTATPLGVRDRTMLEVLYATGLRRAELAALATSDVDLHRRTAFIRSGKGQQDRLVPLGQRATHWITHYLASARPALVAGRPDPNALFVTRDATSISHAHLGRLVEVHLRRAGIRSGNCHLFRHALATLMLRAGADIRWVQAILGHHSLTSTQLYTDVEISHLSSVHAATHPANRPASRRNTLTIHITGPTAQRLLETATSHGLDPHQLLDQLLPAVRGSVSDGRRPEAS